MKILTANFITCAVKACKTSPDSFPLHFKDAELEQVEMEYNPEFLKNVLPRVEWDALRITAAELGFTTLPETCPEPSRVPTQAPQNVEDKKEEDDDDAAMTMDSGADTTTTTTTTTATQTQQDTSSSGVGGAEDDKMWRDLHTLLLETQVVEGKLVCGSCGHEYRIRDGIANMLLPQHLV